MSNGRESVETHRQIGGTDFITSTTEVGGNYHSAVKKNENDVAI